MTDEELKKASRQELLEMLLEEKKKTKHLQEQLDQANKQLEDRSIQIEKAGSLADAVVSINHLFEDADKAADQYLQNVKAYASSIEEQCRQREADTNRKINEDINATVAWVKKTIAETKKRCEEMERSSRDHS